MKDFWFTFGCGHVDKKGRSLANNYIILEAENEYEARLEMYRLRNDKYCTSYSSAEDAGVERFSLSRLSKWDVRLCKTPGAQLDD